MSAFLQGALDLKRSRSFFFWRLQRLATVEKVKNELRRLNTNFDVKEFDSRSYELFEETHGDKVNIHLLLLAWLVW